MRGFMDDEPDEPTPPAKRDPELTLGYFTLLGIFFGLIVLCVLCFGLGYEVGLNRSAPTLALPAGTPAKNAGNSKASTAQQSQTAAQQAANSQPTASEVSSHTAAPAESPSHMAQQAAAAVLPTRNLPAPVQPHPQPMQSGGLYMVQITAVSNPDDGELLVNALKKHGYQVTTRREGDGLIHVRIGPFGNRDEAIRWRQKLLNDGYSATLQQ